jgi:hypothetical protein
MRPAKLQRLLDGWVYELFRHESVHFDHPGARHEDPVFDGHREVRHHLFDRAVAFAEYVDRRIEFDAKARAGSRRTAAVAAPPLREGVYLHWAAKRHHNEQRRLAAALAGVNERIESAREAGAAARVRALEARGRKLQARLAAAKVHVGELGRIPGAEPSTPAPAPTGRLRAATRAIARWAAAHPWAVRLAAVVPVATALVLLVSVPAAAFGSLS